MQLKVANADITKATSAPINLHIVLTVCTRAMLVKFCCAQQFNLVCLNQIDSDAIGQL